MVIVIIIRILPLCGNLVNFAQLLLDITFIGMDLDGYIYNLDQDPSYLVTIFNIDLYDMREVQNSCSSPSDEDLLDDLVESKSYTVSRNDIDLLWDMKLLRSEKPEQLLHTILSVNLCGTLHAAEEHHQLQSISFNSQQSYQLLV